MFKNYSTEEQAKGKHIMFLGRYVPFHKGHSGIIQSMQTQKGLPVLILVRDTSELFPASVRVEMIGLWMKKEGIHGTAMVVPDVEGIYYGRDVGYKIEEIKGSGFEHISATSIRNSLNAGNEEWKDMVAPGTEDIIHAYYLNKAE